MIFMLNPIKFQPTGDRPDQDDFRVFVYDAVERILSNPILQSKAADPQHPFGQAIRESFARQSEAIRLYLERGSPNPIKISNYQNMLNAIESTISSNFSPSALENLKNAYSVHVATIDMSGISMSAMEGQPSVNMDDPTSDVINIINAPPFPNQNDLPPSRDKINVQQPRNARQQQGSHQQNAKPNWGQDSGQSSDSQETDQGSFSKKAGRTQNAHANPSNQHDTGSNGGGGENVTQQQSAASNGGGSGGDNQQQSAGSSGNKQDGTTQGNGSSVGRQSRSRSGRNPFEDFEKKIADARQYQSDIVDAETEATIKRDSEVIASGRQGQSQQNQQGRDSRTSSAASENTTPDDLMQRNQEIINRAKEKLASIEHTSMRKVIDAISSVTNQKIDENQMVANVLAKGNEPFSLDISMSVRRKNLVVSFNHAAKLLKETFDTPDAFISDPFEIDNDSLVLAKIGKGRPILGEFSPITRKGYVSIVLDTSGSMSDDLSLFSSHMLSLITAIKNNAIRYVVYHCDADVSRIDVMERKDAIKFFSKGAWSASGGGGTSMTEGLIKVILDTENLTKIYGSMCALLLYTDCIDEPLDHQLIREAERNARFNIREIPFVVVTTNEQSKYAERFCQSAIDLGGVISYIESRSVKISRQPHASRGIG